MPRRMLTLLAFLWFLQPALATTSPRKDRPLPSKALPPALVKDLLPPPKAAPAGRQQEDFLITDQTEVLLDGRPCKFRDVPRNAGVVKVELAPDKKTVLQVHFRTRK